MSHASSDEKPLAQSASETRKEETSPSYPENVDIAEQSSRGYSDRLTQGHYRGLLNLKAEPDAPLAIKSKVSILAHMITSASCVVLHTGAGISTAAGINDFRGPDGIWTKEVVALHKNEKRTRSSVPQTDGERTDCNDDMKTGNSASNRNWASSGLGKDDNELFRLRKVANDVLPSKKRGLTANGNDSEGISAGNAGIRLRQSENGPSKRLRRTEKTSYKEEESDEGDTVHKMPPKRCDKASTKIRYVPGDSYEMVVDDPTQKTDSWDEPPPVEVSNVEKAQPTLTHMVIAQMQRDSLISSVITQNVDNLHARSGFPRDKLAQLHGNLMCEWCQKCSKEYERDYEVSSAGFKPTGHKCVTCKNELTDNVLDWNAELPDADERRALLAQEQGDLHVVVGSSLQMVPASEYAFERGNRRRTVLINLSKTPKDGDAGLVIRARSDTVFALLARELRLALRPYERKVTLSLAARSREQEPAEPGTMLGRVLFGVHSARGGDDSELSMRIPYVTGVTYELLGQKYEAYSAPEDLACGADISRDTKEGPVRITANVRLENGRSVSLGVDYSGEDTSASTTIALGAIDIRQRRDYETNLIDRTAVDRSCNVSHMKKNFRSWFMQAEKKQHLECVLCGHVTFVGGMHWARRCKDHVIECISVARGGGKE